MKFIRVIFSISCVLALVTSMNDMGSLSFKCIFDPHKTITKIIPGQLVIQHENEYRYNYKTTLQPVDCFINVAKNSIINKRVDNIKELEVQNLRRVEDPLNGIEYNEYIQARKANEIENSNEVREGLQKRKLKRVINTKDGAEIEIYYRSIDEDKQFKNQKFKQITKIVSSKKATDIIPSKNKTIQNLRKPTVYQRSINEDKLFKTKNYTKITKRLKSKYLNGKVGLAKNSKGKVKSLFKDFCNSESVGLKSSNSESCFRTKLVSENYDLETSSGIAASNDISALALIESDKKPIPAVLEGNGIEIQSSHENNIMERKSPVYSEMPRTSNKISDHKSKHALFNKISSDNLLENILFNPGFIYA
ncbi:uncharacterized protein LOC120778401 [Bactrocera tryoni]|uniref:uncharacterized protein LOC120778401 n=1 Tax=Bactrocera tryoni TaxID=59916 RepID=UPI001A980B56|nr:uncharacterized protein LOC120778401 [Bactrocera tryoni]